MFAEFENDNEAEDAKAAMQGKDFGGKAITVGKFFLTSYIFKQRVEQE
jgi:hypothetical protein